MGQLLNKRLSALLGAPLLVLFGFMYLYAFKVVGPFHSAMLTALFSPLLFLLHRHAVSCFIIIVRHKFFLWACAFHFIAFLLAFLVPIVLKTYDYSILSPLLNNLFSLFVAAVLVSSLYAYRSSMDVSQLIAFVLVAQSLIIFFMLFSPELRELIQNHTMNEKQLERMGGYQGVRGLGLAGSVAFGLSVLMGLQGLFLHYWFAFKGRKIAAWLKLLLFFLTLVGAISAGRTAILGFVLGFIFYLISFKPFQLLKSGSKYFLISVLFIIAVLVYIFSDPVLLELAYIFSRYAFQFVWSYIEGRGFEVSSLQTLESMYFIPPYEQWFLGDGYYTNPDGSYYLHTDAGYMRFLLFFGLLGSFVMYGAFIVLLTMAYFLIRKHTHGAGLMILAFAFMAFVYHYKGEVVFFHVGFMKVFYLFVLYELLFNWEKNHVEGLPRQLSNHE